MHFQNPGVLYFLSLLIIPILVHLFQLQKFTKTPFTNVAFLKKIMHQTRKSSRVKKLLILATRMLLFSAIIIAFSKPYFSDENIKKNQHTYIYLDNSLSTNSKGKKGNLLKISAQEIIDNAAENDTYSLQTNSLFYDKITYNELKKELLSIKNSTEKVDIKSILLKIDNLNLKESNTLYKNILITDFQNIKYNEFTNVTSPITGIKLESNAKNNISIDSVFISNTNSTNLQVNITIKNQGLAKNNIPIALFNNQKLISKQSFSIQENISKTVSFSIQKQNTFLGKITVNYNDTFSFDNSFYFSLNNSKKVNILSIGKTSNYLSKIFTKDEFNFKNSRLQDVNYNSIPRQQIIVLNELEKIPETLSKSIIDFSNKGGDLVIIPNSKLDTKSYNFFLNKIASAKIDSKILDSLKITNINFNHPLFKNVFSKRVRNFQYPIVKSFYPISSQRASNLISFENNLPFISQINTSNSKIYWISSSLSKNNSNFRNSPLIVPVFYNFGKLSFKHDMLYYYLEDENKIDVITNLGKDEILTMVNSEQSFIPSQQTFQNKVRIKTKNNSLQNGFYHIINKKDTLKTIAFNNPKEESFLNFLDTNTFKSETQNITFDSSIANVFDKLNKKNEVHWLWKWFLALAIVSLLLEILILKFYKP